ncbi:MAG: MotA/TolQ/ExbB proton channel family protein [Elusimicrobia bacterium]|nr:MotA/TolQ/ExbB proton channel family protein [Elusimicrobiota bacterium]
MDIMTMLGAFIGLGSIVFVLAWGHMLQFLWNMEAIILIFGGTLGSVMISYPFSALRHVPRVFIKVIFPSKRVAAHDLIKIISELAAKARRQGIYTLSEDAPRMPHPFLQDCLGLLGDEMEYEVMREMLDQELATTRMRHLQISNIFRSAGTFAPIFGLLGTLIGVVQVLRNITDPKSMGASMAIAMTASFYGIFMANFVFLPISGKLNFYSEEELLAKELIAKGILCIHKGDNPWEVGRKLSTFLSHWHRNGKKAGAGQPAVVAAR